ncbi:MAG: hypothetical protein ABW076_11005 [Candidatus Thiodiazotropha sp.]
MRNTPSIRFFYLSILTMVLTACNNGGSSDSVNQANSAEVDLTSQVLVNKTAYIPSQCYTRTIDAQGQAHNPCYTCHVPSGEPNYINDGDLQLGYTFAEYAKTNHWSNLFEDRSDRVAAISDAEILDYLRHNNYQDEQGRLILTQKLQQLPAEWDFNANGQWDGYLPDAYFRFDAQGFDTDPDGNPTGWRALAYAPFPGTFWPTNGSTDDVLIRLPQVLRQDANEVYDGLVYQVNLAIVEAMIKRQDVTLAQAYQEQGVDLDKDGNAFGIARVVRYDWAPNEGRNMSYVGMGASAQQAGTLHLAAGLFPEGTEFLHSVRYIDLDEADEIQLAPRMKELRYARKTGWMTYSQIQDFMLNEIKEKDDFPDRLKEVIGNLEYGVSNRLGWRYQGFIEDADGALRPQTHEENVFCVGCHGGIGATADSIFSFPRKFASDAYQAGWYHWSQKGLRGQPEPLRSDGRYEYSYYLAQNHAGDEFRANQEVMSRFFDVNGNLSAAQTEQLHSDMAHLLYPSRERALILNKAYRVIVMDQDFIHGRDASVTPPVNVHAQVEEDQPTGIVEIVTGP